MKLYLLKRILLLFPNLIGISLISFAMIHLAPGNPAQLLENQPGQMNQNQSNSFLAIDEFRRRYHLHLPIYTQYWLWLKKIASFDFGESITYPGKKVTTLLKQALPITLILSIASILLSYIIAIPLGVLISVKENSLTDRSITILLFMLYSLPSFFVAIWLLNLLASQPTPQQLFLLPANLFPAQGLSLEWPILKITHHMILPITCLTLASYAYLTRQTRASMLDVLRKDYIRTAKAKGLSQKIILFKHALRNALIPIVTIGSSILPALISGSVIIEQIFNIPGMGRLSFQAILSRDYNLIMAIFFLSSVLTLIGILIADLLYVILNPQISFD